MDGVENNNNNRGGWRQTMIDNLEADYKVPEDWQNGPVQNNQRGSTDKCCLIIFLLYLILMISTMIFALVNSEHEDITKLYDSSGNACGFDKAEGFEILYLQRFSKPFISVCVKECPSFDYNEIKYKIPGGTDKAEDYPGSLEFKKFNANNTGLSFTKDPNLDFKEAFAFDKKWVNGYYTEEQWNNFQKQFKLECFPNKQVTSCKFKKDVLHFYDSYPVLNSFCTPLAPKPALLFNKVSNKFDHGVVGDMADGVKAFGYCVLIALGISLLFLLLICMCTTIITWVLVILLAVVFITFGAFVIFSIYYTGPLNSGLNAARVKYLYFIIKYKPWLLAFSIVMILLGIILFFLICKFRKYVKMSIPILSMASKASLKNVLLIFLSIFVIITQIGVFFFELYIILRLYTSGEEIHDGKSGSPFVNYENSPLYNFFMVIHFFGMYWLIIVLNNFNDYVCAAVTVNYYFQTDIKNIRIFCHVLGHNVGSVAWSIVLLPTMLVKMVFGVFDYCLTSDNPNKCQKIMNKILCPCCWCYEKFIDRFSESYFPVSYMGSENFCKATTRYYYLSEKYADESSTIIMMGGLFGLVGKLLISIMTGYFGYIFYQNSIELQQNIDFIGCYLILCFLIGFFVGSLFINLYSTTYDSIMVCYLMEKNIEDMHGISVGKNQEIKDILDSIKEDKYKPLN